jgi:hypothetical protein
MWVMKKLKKNRQQHLCGGGNNNIKGKGTTLHNNKKVKVQRCFRYTLCMLVMFYYALTPTYTNSGKKTTIN